MEENAANYFASMSHLASKMMQYNDSVREMYRDTWDGLTWEKQEQLIDQHIIDPKIVDKYASCRRTAEPLNCFPVLKINCGEKIVVDFEHDDGWTWTDEHSAPFSWKTKSQQDLTLLDLEDMGNSKEEQTKKNRVGKKSRSPDRSMFDTAAVAGDRSKNEVEKMFEKFGIKVASGSDDEDKVQQESTTEVITKDPDSTVSPSHLYNERSKLLDDLPDARESKDFVFSSEAALFEKSDVVRKSTSKQNTSAAKKEPKNKSQGGGKKEKGKTGQGKGVKEKTPKKKKASLDSVDSTAKAPPSSSTDQIGLEYYAPSHEELESFPREISFTRPNILEAVSPIRFPEIGESSTDNLQENQEDGADAFVFSPSDLTSGARSNVVFEYSEVEDNAVVVTSQPKKFELDLDGPFATSSELVEAKRDSVVKTGFDFLDNW